MRYTATTEAEFAGLAAKQGATAPDIAAQASWYRAVRRRLTALPNRSIRRLTGRDATTLRQFVEDHRQSWLVSGPRGPELGCAASWGSRADVDTVESGSPTPTPHRPRRMRHVTCSDSARAPMIALAAVILLCVVLPFALSFIADTIVLVVRRGRAGVPALVVVVGLSLAIVGAALLLVYLAMLAGTAPGRVGAGPCRSAGACCSSCVPLAVIGMLLRLWITTLPRRRGGPEA